MKFSKHWSQRATKLENEETRNRRDPGQASTTDRSCEDQPANGYLTTKEAALYLRLSRRTLERYRVQGTGPRYIKAGPGKRARVRYRREDLQAWLEGFVFTSTAEYRR